MSDNKGFSTLELIITIAIAGIIMGAVGSFLVFNLRSFNATTDVIDIQYEGQLAINQLADIAKQSTGILALEDNGSPAGDLMNTFNRTTPYFLQFEHRERDPADPSSDADVITTYDITYDDITNDITVRVLPTDETYILGSYITSYEIEPISDAANFAEADSIQIYLTLESGDASIDLQTHVKFRNKR